MTEHAHEPEAHPHGEPHDYPDAHDHDHDHVHPAGPLRRRVEMFVGRSHDPGDSIDDALTSDRRGIRALKLSLLALGITAVAQLAVVLVSGSVALLADTIHNFSDALTAIPLWIAFAIGSRAATRRYTFGYRRAEDLAGQRRRRRARPSGATSPAARGRRAGARPSCEMPCRGDPLIAALDRNPVGC